MNFVAMPGPEHELWCDLIPKPVVTKLQLRTHCTTVVKSLQIIHNIILPFQLENLSVRDSEKLCSLGLKYLEIITFSCDCEKI